MNEPSPDSLVVLDSLRKAVAKALDRKRRLGQYAVVWEDGKIRFLGEVPPELKTESTDEGGV